MPDHAQPADHLERPLRSNGAVTDLALRPTRPFEPPYDDEIVGPPVPADALALTLPLHDPAGITAVDRLGRDRQPAVPAQRQRVSPAPLPAEPDEAEDALFGAVRSARSDLPAPRPFGARLVQALAEVTAGERPLAQLAPHLSRVVYLRLERHLSVVVRDRVLIPSQRAVVHSVRVCEPRDGVAELAAVVRRGGRVSAVALRLEGFDGRWRCTALQLG